MRYQKWLLIPVAVMLTVVFASAGMACTTIMVGKKASVDGSVMTTHTCDGQYDARLRIIPGQTFEAGAMAPVYKDICHDTIPGKSVTKVGEIPQVAKTYTYYHVGYPFMNEHQVIIGEDTFGGRGECENPQGLMMIEQLEVFGLQRAKTARECIRIMGELAEKYGYADGGETLTVIDAKEAWFFDIVGAGPLWTPGSGEPGAVWAAARIPDDHVAMASNRSRIGALNLKKSDWFMASSNVFSFAQQMGWHESGSEPFLFWKVYNPQPYGAPYYQRRREWRVMSLLAPSLKLDPNLDPVNEQYPFSIKPDKKVSPRDLMAINHDYYEGTQFDLTKGLAAGPFGCPNRYATPKSVRPENLKNMDWERAISIFRCSYSFVGQARGDLPAAIGGIAWFGEDAPHSTCYIPFYAGNLNTPKAFAAGSRNFYDKESAWWVFNSVSNFADLKFNYMIKDIRNVQQDLEQMFFGMLPSIEKTAVDLYKKDPMAARAYLTNFSNNMATLAMTKWQQLGDELVFKYHDGYVDGKAVGYPTEYLETVGFGK